MVAVHIWYVDPARCNYNPLKFVEAKGHFRSTELTTCKAFKHDNCQSITEMDFVRDR